MCTLVAAVGMWVTTPLLVASNRDERLDRPAAPPGLLTPGPPAVLAPRDLRAGGTWWGVSAAGLFAGVTNRFGAEPDPARRSRGELVPLALRARTLDEAAAALRALPAGDYNPFHLLVADRRRALVMWSDGAQAHLEPRAAGIHVLTERSFGAAPSAREALLAEVSASWARGPAPDDEAVAALLRRRAEPAFEGVSVLLPERSYGTRSSSILRFGGAGPPRLLFADGPPDRVAYADLSALAAASLAGGR